MMEKLPFAYLIFVSFILISFFVVLNAFIGVIVNTIGEVSSEDEEESASKTETFPDGTTLVHSIHPDHLAFVMDEVRNLKDQLDRIEKKLSS
jgi:voltage-gated sodium channel